MPTAGVRCASRFLGSILSVATVSPVLTEKISAVPSDFTNPAHSDFSGDVIGTAFASYSFFHTSLPVARSSSRSTRGCSPVPEETSAVRPKMRYDFASARIFPESGEFSTCIPSTARMSFVEIGFRWSFVSTRTMYRPSP